ncbi:dihydrolipoyl dehydrogenase [Chloroflexota bacterium]
MTKSIIIIGGGPGGYVAAIRAAQLGAQVTLVEKDALGGTCLNRGCIPTKALLQSANTLTTVRHAAAFGVSVEGYSVDFTSVNRHKQAVVNRLVNGVSYLMKKNKIRVIEGTGILVDAKTVAILGRREQISADNIVIATGSKPATVPIKGINGPGVITSDEALDMERLPKSMVVIGGGVIGLEFAQIVHGMGGEVTIVEMMPQVLPTEDIEVTSMLENIMRGAGIEVFTDTVVTDIISTKHETQIVSFTTRNNSKQEKTVDKILLAVGRRPNTDNLEVDRLGLNVDNGRLVVNERMETNVLGVYAVGDVIGGLMLAHIAMDEGKCAIENIMGSDTTVDYQIVPRCVYTSPEVASVGLTEEKAREAYGNIKVGRFPFTANGRALILNETAGMVKIIADDDSYGNILGVHIVGPQATELIAEAILGMRMKATFEDIATTIHAHPTLSEAVMEAALNAQTRTIHL